MEKPMTEIFSRNLRNALYMAGMTQSELAKKVNTTETSVSKWINGIAVPRPKTVDAICTALRCKRSDLMIDHDKPVIFAPVDVLANELSQRPELYDLFNASLKLSSSDIELLTALAQRILK